MELTQSQLESIRDQIPEPYNTPQRFGEFIRQKVQPHNTLCTVVKAEIDKLLAPLIRRCENRFFCRIDDSHQLKTPESIIDKIFRPFKKGPKAGEPIPSQYDLKNFDKTMTDLARFRIVCNFLSDVKIVEEAICKSEKLNQKFNIKHESTIDQRPKLRKSGERSVKFVLEYKNQPGLFLEIQVMTQLQEAWDKKDHFLVYETRRRDPESDEENFSDFLDAKMHAMAELLYVADNYFEDLRSSREELGKNKGGQ